MNLLPNPNGIKIYNVSVGKSLPEWISEKKKKKLRYDEDYRRRLELIQDFAFPTASQHIQISPNGEFLMMTGIYPAQLKVYELAQLSMKFERHVEHEVVNFRLLSDDYAKMVFLRADRTVEFHAKFGKYYELRIPKPGRDLLYHPASADLVVCGAGPDIYRVSLEQGQFLSPFRGSSPGYTVCDLHPSQQMYSVGGEDGYIECWDPRAKRCAARLDVGSRVKLVQRELGLNLGDEDIEISSLKFHPDGLTAGVGTSSGHVLLYDLRSPNPLLTKDHQYGYPIKHITFCGDQVISADTKILKLWQRDAQASTVASIEPPANINDVCVVPNSGLIMMACEQPKALAYFIPMLGPAPRWAAFLENLTEELEEDKQTLYEDYKFVTRDELNTLGMTKLLGTEYLKPYMHGFFMDFRLYNKLRALIQPFEYEKFLEQKVQEKLEKQAESRVALQRKLPKVNAATAARMLKEQDEGKAAGSAAAILDDPRFARMFENPDFQVDENDEKYLLLHPTKSTKLQAITKADIEEHFEKVDDASDEEEEADSDDSDDAFRPPAAAAKRTPPARTPPASKKATAPEEPASTPKERTGKLTEKAGPKLYEIKEGHEGALKSSAPKKASLAKLPFAKRLQLERQSRPAGGGGKTTRVAGGGLQLSFVPEADKQREAADKKRNLEHRQMMQQKRGIQDLRLPKQGVKKRFFKRK